VSEKTGRGGLKPKRNLEIRSSFHDDEEGEGDEDLENEPLELLHVIDPNRQWKNDFFLRGGVRTATSGGASDNQQQHQQSLIHHGSDGGGYQSPESLSILNSYEPTREDESQLTVPGSASVTQKAIPIMRRSYFNRSMEPPEVHIPTLADFVEVC
jgi:hypothetical protein